MHLPTRLCLGLTVILLASGCDLPGQPDPDKRLVLPDQVLSFDALFGKNCAGCHGADGRLGPAPPLNDRLFRALIPEKQLEQVIRSGRPGTPMPAFAKENGGALTAAQIQVLVKEIKGTKWGKAMAVPKDAPPYSSEVRGDKDKGLAVYAQACAVCHGEDGKGGEAGAIHDRAFLALISNQAMRRLAITGRPDLRMPDYADGSERAVDFQPLTSQDVADLVALFDWWRNGTTNTRRKQP